MDLIKKYFRLFFASLFISFASYYAYGQTSAPDFDRDSSKIISLAEFNQRVDRALSLLQTKPLSEIADTDHINIMRCYNTIIMIHTEDRSSKMIKVSTGNGIITKYPLKRKFMGGKYDKLFVMIHDGDYFEKMVRVYPDWQPNRGMGTYFVKLQMEIGGTPFGYAIFNVKE